MRPMPEGGRPRPQVTEVPSPFHCGASTLSWAWPLGFQDAGTQKVKPDARTWRQSESGDPTPGTAQGTTATCIASNGCPPQQNSTQTERKRAVWHISPPEEPDGA